jgi:two-component system sensor histidine kinase PilS (NtrC family)
MEASMRGGSATLPEVFLPPEERIPEAFWVSLRYFSYYRIALAAVFLGTALLYQDAVNPGARSVELFRYFAAGYLVCAVALHAMLRELRHKFELQVSLYVCLDIVAITLLMYASGGIKSGLGVMLLISLTGAAIVAPRRLTYLYAALASIALLLEQSYWVLGHDLPTAGFLQPALLAIGYFAIAGVTSWLAARVAANERLARQRGRELATQTRVNQLVIEDMKGSWCSTAPAAWCSTTRRRNSSSARRTCSMRGSRVSCPALPAARRSRSAGATSACARSSAAPRNSRCCWWKTRRALASRRSSSSSPRSAG